MPWNLTKRMSLVVLTFVFGALLFIWPSLTAPTEGRNIVISGDEGASIVPISGMADGLEKSALLKLMETAYSHRSELQNLHFELSRMESSIAELRLQRTIACSFIMFLVLFLVFDDFGSGRVSTRNSSPKVGPAS